MKLAPEVGENWYSCVVTKSSLVGLNIIFNNGSTQTADINAVEGKYYYYGMNATAYATAAEVEEAVAKEQEQPTPEGITLYLKPNSNWRQSSARFAVYLWGSSGTDIWFNMTDTDGDGIYEVVISEETAQKYNYGIIFVRMNGATTANNWNNKWNQTNDLTLPKDGKNLYTISEGAWDKGAGSWSTK